MPKEFILPSGKKAVIADGKGKDLFRAQKIAKSPEEIMPALVAVLTTIDGEPVIFEDMAEMDLPDVLSLVTNSGLEAFFVPTAQNMIHLWHCTGWGYRETEEMDVRDIGFWASEAVKYHNESVKESAE